MSDPSLEIESSFRTHHGAVPDATGRDYSSTVVPGTTDLLKQIEEAATTLGCEHKSLVTTHKSPGHGYGFGVETLYVQVLTVTAAAAAALAALLRQIAPVLVELIKKRAVSGIRVRRGDVEVELKGTNDIEQAIALLESSAASTNTGVIVPGRD